MTATRDVRIQFSTSASAATTLGAENITRRLTPETMMLAGQLALFDDNTDSITESRQELCFWYSTMGEEPDDGDESEACLTYQQTDVMSRLDCDGWFKRERNNQISENAFFGFGAIAIGVYNKGEGYGSNTSWQNFLDVTTPAAEFQGVEGVEPNISIKMEWAVISDKERDAFARVEKTFGVAENSIWLKYGRTTSQVPCRGCSPISVHTAWVPTARKASHLGGAFWHLLKAAANQESNFWYFGTSIDGWSQYFSCNNYPASRADFEYSKDLSLNPTSSSAKCMGPAGGVLTDSGETTEARCGTKAEKVNSENVIYTVVLANEKTLPEYDVNACSSEPDDICYDPEAAKPSAVAVNFPSSWRGSSESKLYIGNTHGASAMSELYGYSALRVGSVFGEKTPPWNDAQDCGAEVSVACPFQEVGKFYHNNIYGNVNRGLEVVDDTVGWTNVLPIFGFINKTTVACGRSFIEAGLLEGVITSPQDALDTSVRANDGNVTLAIMDHPDQSSSAGKTEPITYWVTGQGTVDYPTGQWSHLEVTDSCSFEFNSVVAASPAKTHREWFCPPVATDKESVLKSISQTVNMTEVYPPDSVKYKFIIKQYAEAFLGRKITGNGGEHPTATSTWTDENGEEQTKTFELMMNDVSYDDYVILDTCRTITDDLDLCLELTPGTPARGDEVCGDTEVCCITIPSDDLAHVPGPEESRKEIEVQAKLPNRGYAKISFGQTPAELSESTAKEKDICMDPYDPEDLMDQTVDVLSWETIDYSIDIVSVGPFSETCDFARTYNITAFSTSEGYYSYHDYEDPYLAEYTDAYDPPRTTIQRGGCTAVGMDLIDLSEIIHDIYIPITVLDSGCNGVCEMRGDGETYISYTVGGGMPDDVFVDGKPVGDAGDPVRHDCESQGMADVGNEDDMVFVDGIGNEYGGSQLLNFPSFPNELELVEGQTYEITTTVIKSVYDQAKEVENGGSPWDIPTPTETETTTTSSFTVPIGGYDIVNEDGMSKAFPCNLVTGDCSPLSKFISLNISA